MTLSERTLASFPGPTNAAILRECGHFPLEGPGLDDLVAAVDEMVESALRRQDETTA